MITIAAASWWLFQTAVAPDAFTRIVSKLGSKSEYRRLVVAVKKDAAVRPGAAYTRWFSRDDTWQLLVRGSDDVVQALTDGLETELYRTQRWLRKRLTPEQRRDRAVRLVMATRFHLITSLDAPRGLAVVDHRIRNEISEVKSLLVSHQHAAERLANIPPTASDALEPMLQGKDTTAARVLDVLTTSENPITALRELVTEPPEWLREASWRAWLALAETAHAHSKWELSAQLFEHVAELGHERAENLARAALATAAAGDASSAGRLIERARLLGDSSASVKITAAAIAEDAERLATFATDLLSLKVSVIPLVIEGIRAEIGINEAIVAYRKAIREYPMHAGLRLRLAELLIATERLPDAMDRMGAHNDASRLAIEARDLRRKWRGPSDEAVATACRALSAAGRWREALSLGLPAPDGEATDSEAALAAVRVLTVEAALAIGNIDQAKRLLAHVEDRFDTEFLTAEVMRMQQAETADIVARYWGAWTLARNDDDRLAVQLTLAKIGEELPDQEDLEARNDETSAIILAFQELARDQNGAAIGRLRAWRNRSPQVATLLADILASRNDVDAAATTLEDAARRFDDPRHLVKAAFLLASREGYERADQIAARALTAIPNDIQMRVGLHEIRITAAQQRQDWRDMESRVRALIDEQGPDSDRRWLLAGALFNQRQIDEAWSVLEADPALEPDTEGHARVWIELHARFRPGVRLAERMLELIERFGESEEFTGAAIGWFFMMEKPEPLPKELAERWQTHLRRFYEKYPASSLLQSIPAPDDPEQFVETLRPYLEPGAEDFERLRQQVAAAELPYGMLSAHVSRPYGLALVQRAAGCMAIYPTDGGIAQIERVAAHEALDQAVVIDSSSLVVMSWNRDLWPRMLAAFSRIVFPVPARADLVRTLQSYESRSSGTLGWDTHTGRPTFTEIDSDTLNRLKDQVQWILKAVDDLDVVDWPRLEHVPSHQDIDTNERFLPWLTPLDYAIAHEIPLLADDVVLRRLSRGSGVSGFGSIALLEAINEAEIDSRINLAGVLLELRRQYCVDLPFDVFALGQLANLDQWKVGPAAFAFSRPAVWLHGSPAYFAWKNICEEVANRDVTHMAGWLHAAVLGLCHRQPKHQLVVLASELLIAATVITGRNPEVFSQLLEATRSALTNLGGDNPLPIAIKGLHTFISETADPAETARSILSLSTHLGEQDRDFVRRFVFNPPGQ